MFIGNVIENSAVKNAIKAGVKAATNKNVVAGVVAGVAADTVVDVIKTKKAKGLPKNYGNDMEKLMGRSDLFEVITAMEA